MLSIRANLRLVHVSRRCFLHTSAIRFDAGSTTHVDSPDHSLTEEITEAQAQAAQPKRRKEAFFYFDTIFPIRLGFWDPRAFVARLSQDSFLSRIRESIPEEASSDIDLKVEDVIERSKDGGAFVRLSYTPPPSFYDKGTAAEKDQNDAIVNEALESWLRRQVAQAKNNHNQWYLWGPGRVFLVKGKPFIEDMAKFPNRLIKIEFEGGPPLSLERLYEICRPYGRIRDITIDAKTASVSYLRLRYATAARNCLDGLKVDGRTFHILFEKATTGNAAKDWITNHPRIVIPILAVLLGGVSFIIFDPIREFFVASNIKGTFNLQKYSTVSWIKQETLGRFGLDKIQTKSITGIEKEREEASNELETRLKDWPDGFIVLSGPRGSGKGQLLDKIIANHSRVLVIDCEAICKRGESDDKMVAELARQTCYFPLFGFLNSFGNLIDIASVGLIGTKAGFTTSSDVQIKQILDTTLAALKSVSDSAKEKQKRALSAEEAKLNNKEERKEIKEALAEEGLKDGRIDALAGNGPISELGHGIERETGLDSLIIAGPSSLSQARSILSECEGKKATANVSEELPIVILKGFNSKDSRHKTAFMDTLAEFGANLVENQIAHVIATSDNVLVTKPLAKALPSKPLSSIMLADASAENAMDYVTSKLSEMGKAEALNPENHSKVCLLGGRLSDLEILVQKLRAGATLDEAVEDIISRSATEVKKNIFGDDKEEAKAKEWTQAQAWHLVQLLSKQEDASFEDVLYNGPFAGDDKPLHALEQAEMITVIHREGEASLIKAGRPVWRAAFQRLAEDPIFSAIQTLAIHAAAIAKAEATIKASQEELISLGTLFPNGGKWIFTGSSSTPVEVAARVDTLLGKIRSAQATIATFSEEDGELKKRLKL